MQLAVTQSLGWQPLHLNCINQLFTQQSCLSIASSQNVSSDVSVKCIITSIISSYVIAIPPDLLLIHPTHFFGGPRREKHDRCIFETHHNGINFVLSIKEPNFSVKCSHLLVVSAEMAAPPPPYGQPDRKKTVFC